MQIVVSEEGQIVLPATMSRMLGVRAGDPVEASVEGGRIVLSQRATEPRAAKIVADPISGFPVLDFGPDVPVLTSEMVSEILADFP